MESITGLYFDGRKDQTKVQVKKGGKYYNVSKMSSMFTDTARVTNVRIIMVALCNMADHYIFMLWFVLLSFFFLSFFFLA